jgi:hypothetical protein
LKFEMWSSGCSVLEVCPITQVKFNFIKIQMKLRQYSFQSIRG